MLPLLGPRPNTLMRRAQRSVRVSAGTVLVAGPPEESTNLVLELRRLGVDCWADRVDRVSADAVSLDWADALIVIDRTPEVQIRHRRTLLDFAGPSMLILPAPVPETVCEFLDRGFDYVVPTCCDSAELVARVRRLLRVSGEPSSVFAELAG